MDGDYIKEAETEIAKWESEGPGFIAQVGDVVLWPAQKAAEALVPESVQEAVAKAIESFLTGLGIAANSLIDTEEVRARVIRLRETADHDLKSADQAAKHYRNWHVGYAATEGGVTGAFGLAGLAADIPALFTVALRLIQQIGLSCGSDCCFTTVCQEHRNSGHEAQIVANDSGWCVGRKSFNATFINDVGRAAYFCYRRRWIAEREPSDRKEPVVES